MKSGRPTKPEGQKVTRHGSTVEGAVLPRAGRQVPAPPPVGVLSDAELDLWGRLWSTPIAALWGEADAAGVSRLVRLAVAGDMSDARVLAELRNLEDRYGLNPYSRRLNRWRLEDDPEAEGAGGEGDDLDWSEFQGLRAVAE